MAEIEVTVDNHEAFLDELENVFQWCVNIDQPCKVTGSCNLDNQNAVLLYGHWRNGRQVINALRTTYPLGHDVFDISQALQQRLLDAGVMIDNEWITGCTHTISIVGGTWAGTGKPCWNKYRVKLDDTDAMLLAIKHGGRLEKVLGP